MRSLYWKIFLSFWLATILIIATTTWVTSIIAQKASISIGLTAHLFIATFISGLICYFLSIYLTKPLRSLGLAAKSLATGKLYTRVGQFAGHHNDEIAELSYEFNAMAEQLETLIKSKQRLLQDISHELRSPLARLHIAIELGRKKCSKTAESDFDRMELECLRLNNLIGEVLDFARLDRSTNTLTKSMVDLPTLLESILSDANYEFTEITPRVIVGRIEPCQLSLDARLVHRAIENILRNALRYSPGDQEVRVSLYKETSNESLYIDIEDNGPGVPEEHLTKIFNPFYRVDTAREKKTGGYGLGLAIARQAIQLHDGEIQASNIDGGGFLVRIILPLK